MEPSIKWGYVFALITSIAYSVWYIGAGALLKLGGSTVSPLFVLFMIETISAFLVFMSSVGAGIGVGVERLSHVVYPVLSGLCFVIANYLLFVAIVTSGVPAASAFASAEIVIFTAILWFTTGSKLNGSTYALGAFIVTIGLISVSVVTYGGAYAINFTTIGLGALIALFAGMATYFYYLSVKITENKHVTMFYMQGIEAIVFLLLLVITGGGVPTAATSLWYWPLLVGVGAALFLSFYFETIMMKILINFRSGVVATGYILSDLQLLPVMVYFLIVSPGSWQLYVPGLLLVTLGMALLEWK